MRIGALALVPLALAVRELSVSPYPFGGSSKPDTYLAQASVQCNSLGVGVDLSLGVWEAEVTCSALPRCGGFIYKDGQLENYCQAQSFDSDALRNASVGFVRHVYDHGCQLRIRLEDSIAGLSFTRAACVGSGRPPKAQVERRQAPKAAVVLEGSSYTVGAEAFITSQEASERSWDGSFHSMTTTEGVAYFMPGASHDTRSQYDFPIHLDGYYPLFASQTAAEAFGGSATAVGPTASGTPRQWSQPPVDATYWVPSGATFFAGDFVSPFAMDGYFPLYLTAEAAAKASSDGLSQSHGPGSSTGRPSAWSSGHRALYFMPVSGVAQFYGDYTFPASARDLRYDTVTHGVVDSEDSAAAAAAAAATAAEFPNTATAEAVLAAAPEAAWFAR